MMRGSLKRKSSVYRSDVPAFGAGVVTSRSLGPSSCECPRPTTAAQRASGNNSHTKRGNDMNVVPQEWFDLCSGTLPQYSPRGKRGSRRVTVVTVALAAGGLGPRRSPREDRLKLDGNTGHPPCPIRTFCPT